MESPCSLADSQKGIDISHVVFMYDPHALVKTLDVVSIHIPKGKVTAIVGASGSGKTTLVKLMLGYYPVLEGKINVGGTDVNDLNKDWWRQQCGVVMQEGVIFSESIARNIAVDDSEVDKERLAQAARIACIHDYVMSLPLKYNTKIGRDGVGLSLGQKRRILIARAVYKDPNYIFLDEATNSLDANNERAIVENLAKFYQGKTGSSDISRDSLLKKKTAEQIVYLNCPKCGHRQLVKNGFRVRDFIGLPIGGKKVIIRMKVQRYKCKNQDCDYDRQESIPFATGSCGYTHRFAKYVVDLLRSMTLKDAANLLGVSWDTVKDIHTRHLEYHYAWPYSLCR